MAKPFAQKFYNSKPWKLAREAVIVRDHGRCQLCGRAGSEVDHIEELTEQNINNPDISLNLDNLRLLCHDCHSKKTKQEEAKRKNKKKNWVVLDNITFDKNGFPKLAGSPPLKTDRVSGILQTEQYPILLLSNARMRVW